MTGLLFAPGEKGGDKELVTCDQQQLCQFIGTKESFYIKMTVQIPEYWFGRRTRPLIYYFTTPISRGCDVSTVRCNNALSLNPTLYLELKLVFVPTRSDL